MLYVKLIGNNCFFADVKETVVGCFCALGTNGKITERKLCDRSFISSLKDYEMISQKESDTSSLLSHLKELSGDSRETINTKLLKKYKNNAAYNNLIKSINCMYEGYFTSDLEVREASEKEIEQLKDKLTLTSYKKIWYVSSEKQNMLFNVVKHDKTDLMFHGSPDTNWFSIISNGLKIGKSIVKNGTSHGMGIYMTKNFYTANCYAQNYIGVFETIFDANDQQVNCNSFYEHDYEMEALSAGRHSYCYRIGESRINVFFDTRSVAIRYLIEV